MSTDPARTRFFVIQAQRIIGLVLVMLGLMVVEGRIGLPPFAGYALILLGLADALFVPGLLARRWKTPKP